MKTWFGSMAIEGPGWGGDPGVGEHIPVWWCCLAKAQSMTRLMMLCIEISYPFFSRDTRSCSGHHFHKAATLKCCPIRYITDLPWQQDFDTKEKWIFLDVKFWKLFCCCCASSDISKLGIWIFERKWCVWSGIFSRQDCIRAATTVERETATKGIAFGLCPGVCLDFVYRTKSFI